MTPFSRSRRLVGVGVASILSLVVDGFLPSGLFTQEEEHGIRELTDSTTWRVPAGVTHITVEPWGAGGGLETSKNIEVYGRTSSVRLEG